jgi:ABC-type multidrug transport system ATPase subunit
MQWQHVSFAYGNKLVLDDISCVFADKSIFILGACASGKTTFLKLASGLLEPTQGTISGFPHKYGFSFQQSALLDSKTVYENLEFFKIESRSPTILETGTDISWDYIFELLEILGIQHTVDLYPRELSGGMRRRVGILRSIITKPKVLFIDEPAFGLDPISRFDLIQVLYTIQKNYGIQIIACGSSFEEAWQMPAQEIWVLNHGKIIEIVDNNHLPQTMIGKQLLGMV